MLPSRGPTNTRIGRKAHFESATPGPVYRDRTGLRTRCLLERGRRLVTRQRTPRRGGVTEVTLGNLAIALSVVAMLAVGPRTLGTEAFAGFALAWTATTLFGYGLAMPTEQLVARRVSAGLSARTRVPIIR